MINTALLIFLVLDRRGRLGATLALLQREDDHQAARRARCQLALMHVDAPVPPRPLLPERPGRLHTFRRLLAFWRSYYLVRRKDAVNLEFSSGVSFLEWETTVRRVLGEVETRGRVVTQLQ